MAADDAILKQALTLKPEKKAKLIDMLLSSLHESDMNIEDLWAAEAESRINAYEQGKINAIDLEEVLKKYR